VELNRDLEPGLCMIHTMCIRRIISRLNRARRVWEPGCRRGESEMTEKQYMVFKNKCAMCGCEQGILHFRWAFEEEENIRIYAHQRGHTVSFFECNDCGAVTRFERIPMITGVAAR